MTTLVPILGDQLSHTLASLRAVTPAEAVVLMMEVAEETTYVRHHKRKIAFILSAMRERGLGFAAALAEAQALGYAEADPAFDVQGTDAAHKLSLLAANACTACHGVKNKIVGPSFVEIAAKHKGKADLEAYLAGKIKSGGSGVYGAVPMPAQPQLSDADAKTIAGWIAAGPK